MHKSNTAWSNVKGCRLNVCAQEISHNIGHSLREAIQAMQAPSETSHYAGLRRQNGKAKQLDSCSEKQKPIVSFAVS